MFWRILKYSEYPFIFWRVLISNLLLKIESSFSRWLADFTVNYLAPIASHFIQSWDIWLLFCQLLCKLTIYHILYTILDCIVLGVRTVLTKLSLHRILPQLIYSYIVWCMQFNIIMIFFFSLLFNITCLYRSCSWQTTFSLYWML